MRAVLTVPELPEVETLRRGLAERITGMTITAAEILNRKISGGPATRSSRTSTATRSAAWHAAARS